MPSSCKIISGSAFMPNTNEESVIYHRVLSLTHYEQHANWHLGMQVFHDKILRVFEKIKRSTIDNDTCGVPKLAIYFV